MAIVILVNDQETLKALALVSGSLLTFVRGLRYKGILITDSSISSINSKQSFLVSKEQLRFNINYTLQGYESFCVGNYVKRLDISATTESIKLLFLFITTTRLNLRKLELQDNRQVSVNELSNLYTHFGHSIDTVKGIKAESNNLQALLGHLGQSAKHTITTLVVNLSSHDSSTVIRLIALCINVISLTISGVSGQSIKDLLLPLVYLHIDTQRGLPVESFLFCKSTLRSLAIVQTERYRETTISLAQFTNLRKLAITLPNDTDRSLGCLSFQTFITSLFSFSCAALNFETLQLMSTDETKIMIFNAANYKISKFTVIMSDFDPNAIEHPFDNLLNQLLSNVPNHRRYHQFIRFFNKNLVSLFVFRGVTYTALKTTLQKNGIVMFCKTNYRITCL